ncbi:MAG: hypothetical protein JRM99_06940 [Nitrososphaerota archaeon]|nr:hypothetical protein [Nitrososphaerota archaeon]
MALDLPSLFASARKVRSTSFASTVPSHSKTTASSPTFHMEKRTDASPFSASPKSGSTVGEPSSST